MRKATVILLQFNTYYTAVRIISLTTIVLRLTVNT